ncbi:MAG: MBOAT family protein [Planctomycetes bacterium]|nr:MBOAT family protein [Planctomycetota bacterium]
MVFSSHIFVYYFLPLLLVVYFNFPHRARNALLVVVSYLFYGWWNPYFMSLMLLATLVNYGCGQVICRPGASRRARRTALIGSVVASLGLLAFFKYFMFLTHSVNSLLAWCEPQLPVLRVTLPIGISFYTFQALSYTVDVYRGDARPARSLVDFACFVSLFPQLIAGPILRYHTVAEQLVARQHTSSRVASGITLFIVGFAKKILLANTVGGISDEVFRSASPLPQDAWFGVVAYAFQIYFDFSAYSDMAVGLGRIVGFEFPRNFNAPYLADSITDFWRRWHISLSTFLRDYLYVPLGGNRKGPARTYVNLATVMLFGGLWHGANWTFVVWGAMHGALLIWERAMDKKPWYAAFPRPVRVALTFGLVLVSWVFFRADSLSDAGDFLAAMFGLAETPSGSWLLAASIYSPVHLLAMAACVAVVVQPRQAFDWSSRPLRVPGVVGLLVLFVAALAVMSTQSLNPFLYFQF